MYVSDEPGFYRDGEWGVRIESDLLVVPATDLPYATGSRPFLKFDYVTKVGSVLQILCVCVPEPLCVT
jgi:Xaa-Pro aminopeptidase